MTQQQKSPTTNGATPSSQFSEKNLRYLQEKYGDLLKSDVNSTPSAEIPASEKYEHEMIRSETKEMRALRWGCALISIIFSIFLALPFLFYMLSPRIDIITNLVFCLIFLYWNFLMVKSVMVYHSKIKLTITDKELLIRSPRSGILAGPNFLKIKIPIHEIIDASIRNPRSPELRCIIHEYKRFKVPNNRNLYWTYWIHRSPYQYVLIVNDQPFSDSFQFIDLKLQNRGNVLVEFDDVENFVNVLKKRAKF